MNEVTLDEMLNAREHRALLQQQLIQQYKKTLICLTLNIPGPVKVLPGVPGAFEKACAMIDDVLQKNLILINHLDTCKEKTGYEAIFCVDAPPKYVKNLMVPLEDDTALGRLFDIDVLDSKGEKISREELGYPPRRCLLCDETAQVCGRSRRHTVPELVTYIQKILDHEGFIEERK